MCSWLCVNDVVNFIIYIYSLTWCYIIRVIAQTQMFISPWCILYNYVLLFYVQFYSAYNYIIFTNSKRSVKSIVNASSFSLFKFHFEGYQQPFHLWDFKVRPTKGRKCHTKYIDANKIFIPFSEKQVRAIESLLPRNQNVLRRFL